MRQLILMLALAAVFSAVGCATHGGGGGYQPSSDGHVGHSH